MSFLSNKIVMVLLVGVALAGVGWYSFLRTDSTALLQTEDLTAGGAVDGDVVTILLQLRAVSLSGTIFGDPAFISLKDFGSQIVPEPVGRTNPFAPLSGGRTGAVGTSTAPQTNPQSGSPAGARPQQGEPR